MDNARLPPLVQLLVDAPYGAKIWAARRPRAWRYYTGACRRLGWNHDCLGWHTPRNGPFAGIRIEALHTSHVWAPAGLYEPAVAQCLVRLLQEPRIAAGEMWDVGANRGLMALLAARHGAARVVAIEAAADQVAMLERQLAANPVPAARVHVVHAAASDSDGPAARAIDSLVAERRARVALLRINVDSAEALVLKGARHLLGEQAPVVVLEVHDEDAGRQSISLLRGAGYTCRHLDPDGVLSPLEDVVGYRHVIARAES